jgi:pyruvate ferredoxin oxidoreductase gamma subunit
MHIALLDVGAPMIEIRIHGRGGQGNVMAAYILAQAACECGKFAQAFPSFGPERRGAPVTAFVRIADAPIRRHCQVAHPALLVLQDHALLHSSGVTEGLLPRGGILINWSKQAGTPTAINGHQILTVPAARLALEFLGRPLPNTALLAALVTVTGILPLEALERAVARRFQDQILERNLRLMRAAAEKVPAGMWKEIVDARGD